MLQTGKFYMIITQTLIQYCEVLKETKDGYILNWYTHRSASGNEPNLHSIKSKHSLSNATCIIPISDYQFNLIQDSLKQVKKKSADYWNPYLTN